jgi:hypothetical protein
MSIKKMLARPVIIFFATIIFFAGEARASQAVYDVDDPGNSPYRSSVQNLSCKSNRLCTLYFQGAGSTTNNRIVVKHVSCGFGPVGPNVTPVQANLVNGGQAKGAPVMTNYLPIIFNALDFSTTPAQSSYVVSEETTAVFTSNETPLIYVQLSDPTTSNSATFVTCSLTGYVARPQ